MLTLAEVPLLLPEPGFATWISDNIPVDRATQLLTRSWPGFGPTALAFPNGFRLPLKVILNRFLWPSGASRFAIGHFLADSEQASAIRDVAFGKDGNQNNPIALKMNSPDETGSYREQVTVNLYLLPPVPLAFVPPDIRSGDAAYLLTVVDQRFYWWQYAAPNFGINDSAGKTWDDVFNSIADTLNIDIDVGTIDSDYLQPSRGLNLTYENLPMIFDAAAWSVGKVVVCRLNNAVLLQDFTTAKQKLETDATNNPWRSLRAGTDIFADDL